MAHFSPNFYLVKHANKLVALVKVTVYDFFLIQQIETFNELSPT